MADKKKESTPKESKPIITFGRTVITSSVTEITKANVFQVIQTALNMHILNRGEIQYLYDYFKGKQPILLRAKDVRPEINNMIVINRANEIVAFKTAYLCGKPIKYVGRSGDEAVTEGIKKLNDFMDYEGKPALDHDVIEWGQICGTAYRMGLADTPLYEDEAGFEIFTLDPRNTFVIYSTDVGHKPILGVYYTVDDDGVTTYNAYTHNRVFKIHELDGTITEKSHTYGMIPIIEYPANRSRLGAFETVISLLDAINLTESNRLDGLEQFVQAFIKFINCDITSDDFEELKKKGAIKVRSIDGQKADVDIVSQELSQSETQTLIDDLYQTVLTICGMPNPKASTNASTGTAVILDQGLSFAESRAETSELMFKESENEFLKLILRICEHKGQLTLKPSDIDIKFLRSIYENAQSKAQTITTLLGSKQIHPLLCFQASGLWSDAENAYAMSEEYKEEQRELAAQFQQSQTEPSNDEGNNGSDDDKNNNATTTITEGTTE
jgi:SPP1 family phage portal protein